jgi:hypothetical protein
MAVCCGLSAVKLLASESRRPAARYEIYINWYKTKALSFQTSLVADSRQLTAESQI